MVQRSSDRQRTSLWVSLIPKSCCRHESVIPQAGVAKQVGPFNDLDDTPELAVQLLNAA
jgi:hypothetical protein